MPGFDGTGPMGAGPGTGGGFGPCGAGSGRPVYGGGAFGRGGGGRGGGGRGYRNMYYATGLTGWQRAGWTPPPPTDQVEALKSQAEYLEATLSDVRARIDGLQNAAESK